MAKSNTQTDVTIQPQDQTPDVKIPTVGKIKGVQPRQTISHKVNLLGSDEATTVIKLAELDMNHPSDVKKMVDFYVAQITAEGRKLYTPEERISIDRASVGIKFNPNSQQRPEDLQAFVYYSTREEDPHFKKMRELARQANGLLTGQAPTDAQVLAAQKQHLDKMFNGSPYDYKPWSVDQAGDHIHALMTVYPLPEESTHLAEQAGVNPEETLVIGQLYVEDKFQGHGLAQKLCWQVLDAAKRGGYESFMLVTAAANKKGTRFHTNSLMASELDGAFNVDDLGKLAPPVKTDKPFNVMHGSVAAAVDNLWDKINSKAKRYKVTDDTVRTALAAGNGSKPR